VKLELISPSLLAIGPINGRSSPGGAVRAEQWWLVPIEARTITRKRL